MGRTPNAGRTGSHLPYGAANCRLLKHLMKQSESRLQKSGHQKMEAALMGDQTQQLPVVSRFAARGTTTVNAVWLTLTV